MNALYRKLKEGKQATTFLVIFEAGVTTKQHTVASFWSKKNIRSNDETIPSMGQTKYTNAFGIYIVS